MGLDKRELTRQTLNLVHANNKGADQPAQSDQHLWFWFILKKTCFTQNLSILTVAQQTGLPGWKYPKTGFRFTSLGMSSTSVVTLHGFCLLLI